MNLNAKVELDANEAIEKLERIRDLYKEIIELQRREVNVNLSINNPEIQELIENID
ncbi:hypothetical protein [Staphylococcus caledonicus]|uniref:hypothetical protein n=1 Tax=Staphylococcus caledonicus TaxID=2741333 RepID=UPI0018E46BD6|nr:hypothetical protein [Staphylococcus caledonicus]MBI5972218.1 hypothetical protein [Staphylococcus caledonicus]